MSTIKIQFILFFQLAFTVMFSQANQKEVSENIIVNLSHKVIKSYIIDKDTTSISICLYIKGYESKKKREKDLILFKKKYNGSDFVTPSFTINIVSLAKPERLYSLDGIKYTVASTFSKGNLKTSNPFYIIIKQNDGTYLKWKSFEMPVE